MSGTTVDATLVALTAKFNSVKPPTWQVSDGPTVEAEPNYLYVGYSTDDNRDAVQMASSVADAGMLRDLEVYDIACELSAWTGDAEVPTVRAAAIAAYNTFVSALGADSRLSAHVMRARTSGFGMVQAITPSGAVVTVRFSVHVEATK
jgi:transcription elongation factor